MKTLSLLLIASLSFAADKVGFEWKPVKGHAAEFRTTNAHRADFGDGEQDLVIAWDTKLSIDKVEGKRVWLKMKNGEPRATIAGQDAMGIEVMIPDSLEEHGADMKFYRQENDHGMGFGLFSGFQLPQKPVEPGESYTIGGLKATYVGKEKVEKWDAHKFTFTYRTEDKDAAWSEGTIWLDTKDLFLVKRKAVLHGIDFGMGPEDITNEIVRTK